MLGVFVLALAIEAGYTPDFVIRAGDFTPTSMPLYFSEQVFYQNTELRLTAFDLLFVECGTKTSSLKGTGVFFAPVNMAYTAGAGVTIGGFTAGVSHLCTHPAISYLPSGPRKLELSESGTSFYLRYEAEFNL